MADEEKLKIFKRHDDLWDYFRERDYSSEIDFSGADLREDSLKGEDLHLVNFSRANLSGCDLRGTHIKGAKFKGANLSKVNFSGADLSGFDLSETNLSEADLSNVNLSRTNLRKADLRGTILTRAILIETNLVEANLMNCLIYGIAAWDVQLEGAEQLNLTITPINQPSITVDNLEVAQFIYLLLNNERIRQVIDTITTKVVLILGRFTPKRKVILDAIRNKLREYDYLPVVFDFDKPAHRDLTETVSTLAHLARFIITDLTDPNSIPHEVATIIPQCKVPVQPLLSLEPLIVDGKEVERREYPMFRDLRLYPWVLPTYRYQDQESLLLSLKEYIIQPAEQKAKELEKLKE